MSNKTSTGLQENVACLLCYVLWWVSGIVFLVLEPDNKTIKFHAFQSIIVFGALWVAILVFAWIPFIGPFFTGVFGAIAFILWLVLIVMAAQDKKYKIPWAGDMAEKWAS